MGLTDEQRAKLEELKAKEENEKMINAFFSDKLSEGENKKNHWIFTLLHTVEEFANNTATLDDIQRYYWEFEKIIALEETELARRLKCTQQTIRNYVAKGVLKILTTEKASCNPDGERRYYDLSEALTHILDYKACIAELRKYNRNKGNKPDRGKDGKFTKSE